MFPTPSQLKTLQEWIEKPRVRMAMGVFFALCLTFLGVFTFFYIKYQRIVDERLSRPMFNNAAQIYAAPERIGVGDALAPQEITRRLMAAGYSGTGEESPVGTFRQQGEVIEIAPGAESYHPEAVSRITFDKGKIKSIVDARGAALPYYELEPQLITGLFDGKERSKRRVLTFDDIPKVVVDAIISVEDRRFYDHNGINFVRLAEGVLNPVMNGGRMQGGSTLTMQLARGVFLTSERKIGRKLAEMLIAIQLEQRFTKQEILALYVNHVDLGQRGSFNIRGFGEAAHVYFGKDIQNLTPPEAALLAGLVNGPSYFSPFRHPKRAQDRRNLVLRAMLDNKVLDKPEFERAKATPVKLAPPNSEARRAPYFVDLVRDKLLERYPESELNEGGLRVYTSLDPQLQLALAEAIDVGMEIVDDAVRRQLARKAPPAAKGAAKQPPPPLPRDKQAQVAVIVLDPETGDVLALSGGRDYGQSQLNRAVSSRPTGSIFKPFVFAAALNTALTDRANAVTQASIIDGSEGSFDFRGESYTPRNFDSRYSGPMSTRFALMHSVNNAAVRLAERVGYNRVVQLAKAAGINDVKATPSMAVGSYGATPLEMAGAYTVFANGGVRTEPRFLRAVRGGDGEARDFPPRKTPVLDPRVAFLLTDMMQAVVDSGTASGGVRSRFNGPAAGKTGSSHDAWFAGYTSNLLCLVWVGNDDYTDIKIEGGKAAAPIWAEFMARARKLPRYKDMKWFNAPSGVTRVQLDKNTNLLATSGCPDTYSAYFIDGTAPTMTCDAIDDTRNIFQKLLGIGRKRVPETFTPSSPISSAPAQTERKSGRNEPEEKEKRAKALPPPPVLASAPRSPGHKPGPTESAEEEQPKKRGFWKRVFGVGGGDDKDK